MAVVVTSVITVDISESDITIACDFQELEPIFDTDYIGADGANKNLRPVADNAVGW